MLRSLSLENVGPAPTMSLDFGDRLNILTGDNGLGKSFLLDIAWWTLTRTWPAQINSQLTSGKMALPRKGKKSTIAFDFTTKTTNLVDSCGFDFGSQYWKRAKGRPGMPGLVFYAMSDGSFAAWDPARNYWKTPEDHSAPLRPPAYVFSPTEVWDGLKTEEGKWLCNGLIRDWATWQAANKETFTNWKKLLKHLSPPSEEMIPGALTRIDLDDVRDMPTLKMPYGQDVPIVHVSSGMRRVIALAYFLLWGWQEHLYAAEIRGESPSNQVIFLIDEVESHLHPRWQQVIIPTLLSLMKSLHRQAKIQLITATHSPLIMSSVETTFDSAHDAWFDIDFKAGDVILEKKAFEKHGDADSWLTSEAFDLRSSRSPESQKLIDEMNELLKKSPTEQEIHTLHEKICQSFSPTDPFMIRWQYYCDRKGLLK
ncbi:MAG: AAA family ATPase [Thermoguttaceae bacterium]